jgi:CheY-like chemotaxis protein
VLVADDSAVNREVAGGLLEMLGHQVQAAKNGREAFEAARRESFDLVLMDVEMPEMDGYEATRAIRAAEAGTGTHLPIIAMSAHAVGELETVGREAGMDHFVSKPIDPAQLQHVLENLDRYVARCVS